VIPSFLLFLLFAAAGVLSAAFAYLRREPDLPGRRRLILLRGASFGLLALLLVNPPLPGDDPEAGEEPRHWILVDGGYALDVPHAEGESLRQVVVERAVERARTGARLALLGPEPEGVDSASLRGSGPRPPVTDPAPALRRLAEAGADSILVLSPFRMSSASLERALEAASLPVRLEAVGDTVRNAGIRELELPPRVPAGEAVSASLVIFGEGGTGVDSVEVELRADGAPVELLRLPLPPTGAPRRLELELPAVGDTGTVRYEARVRLDGDVFPLDDVRVRHLRIGPPEGGILLVSLQPDWEPRVLLPVLEAATGIEGEGFLRVGDGDRWLPLGEGDEAASPVGSQAFRERIPRTALLVLHGAAGDVPDWLREAVDVHPRVIHLPSGPAGAALAGLSPGSPRPGEWVPDATLPPSPVAAFLSGIALAELPPLTDLRAPGPAGGIQVLRVRIQAGGEAHPALVLRETGEGRRAVALARGFWRWANRSGPPREAYRGLWSGVAGWLLQDETVAAEGPIRPTQPVVARDQPFEWHAPEAPGAELRLEFRPLEGDDLRGTVVDETGSQPMTVPLDEQGRGPSSPLAPGLWHWTGRVEGRLGPDGQELDPLEGEGVVEVEGWTGALAIPPVDPVPVQGPVEADHHRAAPEHAGRPLRTHPVPWILLLALLCGEWVLRRRAGLR
jgi:hypothetical protein